MVKQVIGIGTAPDDGLGDPIRTAFTKSNDNFTELFDVLPAEVGATADQSDAEIETAYNNQVGAVSQVVAEAGTDTAITRWTAQRVAQAIAALASGSTTELSRTLGYNGTGGTLVKGKPVLFSGIQGSDPAIIAADSDGAGTMPAIGVVQADIADTATGYVVTDGPVTGLDTSTWTAKDALYVSDTGVLTSTVPANSDDTVQEVARVVYSHATTGIIIVQPRIAGSPLIDGASWKDNNDNEVFEVGVVASAVNHVKLTNAITGIPAQIEGGGTGSNNDRLKILRPQAEHEYNPQIGTTYTLVLADQDSVVTMSNAATNTLTIPPNSSVAFPIGSVLSIYMIGAGTTVVKGGAGVTLSGNGGSGATYSADIQTQYNGCSVVKIATDQWMITGDIDAVAA